MAGTAIAQDRLSLTEAVRSALAYNRSLQAGAAGVREADSRVVQARSAYFPRVTFTESWQRGNQPVFVFSSLLSSRKFAAANFAIDSLNNPDPTGFFHAQVSFEQVVFDGGRTGASVDAAGLQRDMAVFSADSDSAATSVAVIEVYGRALTARASGIASAAAVAAAQEDLMRATLRRDAGALSDADVLAVAAHLAATRQQQVQADGDASVAQAELNRLTGAPIDRRFEIEEPSFPDAAIREAGALPALFDEADSRRPDLRRAAATERLAESARESARSSWYPQIAAQAGVEASGTSALDRASSWVVGGELRWTFSTGGAEFAQRRAAAESAVRARLEREDARAGAQVEIAAALQRLNTALAGRDAARATVASATENRRVVRDRFEAGLASTSDLLHAETAVVAAETARASSIADVLVARARLDRAIGRAPLAITRPSP